VKKDLNISERAPGLKQTIIDLRKEFHQNSELALREFNTAKKVERILKTMSRKFQARLPFWGTKSAEKGITYPHHHPRFDIDKDVLPAGAALNAAMALEFLRKGKGEAF
jgi:metal-dependent amidase/aminoacylase/carboxypeptidase family protein